MKHILISAIVLLAASVPALAQSDALPFTRIERDPVAAGMAGASVSSSSHGAYSAFRNAAVLPFTRQKLAAGVSYQRWTPDVSLTNNIQGGFAYKLSERMGVSVGFATQSGEAFDQLNNDGSVAGSITPKDNLVAVGLGFGVSEAMAIGVNARYAMQNLGPDASYNGVSGDLFVLYHPSEALDLTAGISTLGTSVKSVTKKSFSQPASVNLGAAYRMGFAEIHAVEATANADYYFSGSYGVALGAEYGWNGMVFARAGYRLASKEAVIPTHAALGLGFQYKGIRLDAAWLTASKALGNTLAFGLGYAF